MLQRGWNHQPVSREIIYNFSRESPAHRSPAKGIWHDDNPPFEMQPVAWQVGIGTHRHPLRPAFDLRKCWHMLAPFSHLQPCCGCNFLRSSTWTNNIGFWLVLHRWRMRNCYLKFDRTLDSLSVGKNGHRSDASCQQYPMILFGFGGVFRSHTCLVNPSQVEIIMFSGSSSKSQPPFINFAMNRAHLGDLGTGSSGPNSVSIGSSLLFGLHCSALGVPIVIPRLNASTKMTHHAGWWRRKMSWKMARKKAHHHGSSDVITASCAKKSKNLSASQNSCTRVPLSTRSFSWISLLPQVSAPAPCVSQVPGEVDSHPRMKPAELRIWHDWFKETPMFHGKSHGFFW